jgi:glycosyltransferase 2 family protein
MVKHVRTSVFVGVIAGAVCLAVVLTKVEIRQSWKILSRLKGHWIYLALAVSWANLLLRGWRWQCIFPIRSRPGLRRCLQVLAVGNMGNNLLPGRAGDLARCALIQRNISMADSSEALATLGVEKVVDGFALLGFVLLSMWMLTPPRWVWQLGAASGVIFTAAILLFFFLRFWAESVEAAIVLTGACFGAPGLADRAVRLLRPFAGVLRAINSVGQVIAIVAATAAIWFTEAAVVWLLASALSVPLAAKAAVVVAAVIGLGFMIPAAPAGLGTYEAFGVAAFQFVGVAASGGLAATVLLHAWTFLVGTGVGLLCCGLTGWRFSQLRRAEE